MGSHGRICLMLWVSTNHALICKMGSYVTYISGLVKDNLIQGQILIRYFIFVRKGTNAH